MREDEAQAGAQDAKHYAAESQEFQVSPRDQLQMLLQTRTSSV